MRAGSGAETRPLLVLVVVLLQALAKCSCASLASGRAGSNELAPSSLRAEGAGEQQGEEPNEEQVPASLLPQAAPSISAQRARSSAEAWRAKQRLLSVPKSFARYLLPELQVRVPLHQQPAHDSAALADQYKRSNSDIDLFSGVGLAGKRAAPNGEPLVRELALAAQLDPFSGIGLAGKRSSSDIDIFSGVGMAGKRSLQAPASLLEAYLRRARPSSPAGEQRQPADYYYLWPSAASVEPSW